MNYLVNQAGTAFPICFEEQPEDEIKQKMQMVIERAGIEKTPFYV